MNAKQQLIVQLCIIVCFTFAFTAASEQEKQVDVYQDISAAELKQRIEDTSDTDYIILDIRDAGDYEDSRIPGAVNIPLKEMAQNFGELDRTKDIIVYCDTGKQSIIACRILTRLGFKDVYNLTSGLQGWEYAMEMSDGKINI